VNHTAYEPDDIDVRIAELLMAIPDEAEPFQHPKVQEALHVLRIHLDMDVAFISQFKHGRRTYRVVDSSPQHTAVQAGHSDPVAESWCLHVVEGRLPRLLRDAGPYVRAKAVPHTALRIGTHLSTPVVLRNGKVYGTLCCFSADVKADVSPKELGRMRLTAQLLADDLRLNL
jgi:hypothetical protein